MTRENNLMVFNNSEFGQVRVIGDSKENIFLNLHDICVGLGYTKSNSVGNIYLRKDLIEKVAETLAIRGVSPTDTNIIIDKDTDFDNTWVNEESFYDFVLESRAKNAREFRKWVTSDILPKIRQTGSYDIIENNINQIKDERERGLALSVYRLEQAMESNPSDFMTGILLQQKKAELESYKQEKRLNKVEESVNLIQEQSVFIPDRITFSEKINILARKYFNKEVAEAYRTLYNKMKILGGFDVPRRLENRKEEMQLDRIEQGKKPYAESTLKSKITGLDIIEEFDKWELAGEAYKAIENERFLESK